MVIFFTRIVHQGKTWDIPNKPIETWSIELTIYVKGKCCAEKKKKNCSMHPTVNFSHEKRERERER